MATWEQYVSERVYSAWCGEHSGHEEYVCTMQHEDGGVHCMFCAGGLFACVRCNGFEGATTSECPGISMTSDQSDRVYAGIIDYRFGQWVAACTVVMLHLGVSPPEPPSGMVWDWDEVERYISSQPYEPMVVDA